MTIDWGSFLLGAVAAEILILLIVCPLIYFLFRK